MRFDVIWFARRYINMRNQVIFATPGNSVVVKVSWMVYILWGCTNSGLLSRCYSPWGLHHSSTSKWSSYSTRQRSLGARDSQGPCLPPHNVLFSISLGARPIAKVNICSNCRMESRYKSHPGRHVNKCTWLWTLVMRMVLTFQYNPSNE